MKIVTPDGFVIEGTYDEVMKAYKELSPASIMVNFDFDEPSFPLRNEPQHPWEQAIVYGTQK